MTLKQFLSARFPVGVSVPSGKGQPVRRAPDPLPVTVAIGRFTATIDCSTPQGEATLRRFLREAARQQKKAAGR